MQHYKRRKPPWIKLYRDLLDDRNYRKLNDFTARILFDLWMLAAADASELLAGCIEYDIKGIAWRLRLDDEQQVHKALTDLEIAGFLDIEGEDASVALALRQQSATPETETEDRDRVQIVSGKALEVISEVEKETSVALQRGVEFEKAAMWVITYFKARMHLKDSFIVDDKKKIQFVVDRLRELRGEPLERRVSVLMWACDGATQDDFLMGRNGSPPKKTIQAIYRDNDRVSRHFQAAKEPDGIHNKLQPLIKHMEKNA